MREGGRGLFEEWGGDEAWMEGVGSSGSGPRKRKEG